VALENIHLEAEVQHGTQCGQTAGSGSNNAVTNFAGVEYVGHNVGHGVMVGHDRVHVRNRLRCEDEPKALQAVKPDPRSAADLIASFRSGECSPIEIVEDTLRRIEASDINAFWRVDVERALASAADSERAYQAGVARRLEGVPIGVKDIFDTAGLETTSGSSFLRGRVPEGDAVAVAALRNAGAIVVGKTATHEFAFGVTTVNPHYGPTHHPTHRGHIVGGSSGGSAAAVAAGLVPIALGSDTSVSIREPSAFCGVFGLRPTHGSVSLDGAMPLSASFDTAGPIAGSIGDLGLAAEALWADAPGPGPSPLPVAPSRALRVGLMVDGWPLAPRREILEATLRMASLLRGVGHVVGEVVIDEFAMSPQIFSHVMLPEALEVHTGAGWWPSQESDYGRDTAARLQMAEDLTEAQRATALLDRAILQQRMRAFFQDYDVLLTPSAAISAPTMEDCDAPFVNGVSYPIRDLLFPFQVPAPLCGMPSLALPSGITAEGLPTSVLISAAPRHDRLLLAVAQQIMKELQ
jgi:aspartyl-tRNA(Asn)/glutamyl-tRNA(Gln) amidotransferase subunit A